MSRIISRIETDGTGGTTGAHASTHQKGGTDEVTLEISQLVDFPSTMTPSAHTHAKADLTDATATPTAGKIPIADGSGKLDGWVTPSSGGGTPSSTVTAETSFGASSSAGTSDAYSRGDHTHGTPANPVTAHESSYAHANLPTSGEKEALAGTSGTPGSGNKYVTNDDSRNTNARTPTAHAASHGTGQTDAVTIVKAQVSDFPAFGTTSGTICQGNDSRLSDSRTPTSHTHAKADLTDATATPTAGKIPIADGSGKLDGWVTGGGTPSAHASTHIRGASDEIDGDKLDIDWNPTNYTPTTVTEADNADHLSAHLKGIDTALGSVTASNSISIIAGESLLQYDVVYLHTDAKCYKAVNNSTKAVAEVYAIVTQSGGISAEGTGSALRQGDVNGSWPFASGGLPVFLSSTAGAITTTEPTTPGTYWVPIGETTTASTIYFAPSTGVLIGTASGAPILTGAMASRPTAGVSGRIYLPTDGYPMSYDNGGGWDTYVNGFRCTAPPAASTLTVVNGQAETTCADDYGGLLFTKAWKSTGESLVCYLREIPAAPYTFTVGIEIKYIKLSAYGYIGPCLTNGTSNPRVILFNYMFDGALKLYLAKYSSPTSFSATYTTIAVGPPVTTTTFFMRFRDDNTNRYFEISGDGTTFYSLYSVGRTDYCTPTHIGINVGESTANLGAGSPRVTARVFHWSLG